MMLTVTSESPASPDARRLLAALNAELDRRYPEFGGTPYDPAANPAPGAAFVVARLDGVAVGCGALRPLHDGVGEIKRMFVVENRRGQGIAGQVLGELERRASACGYAEVWLETGLRQPEALALYERMGYGRIPNYGPYAGDPLSVCFRKTLRPEAG